MLRIDFVEVIKYVSMLDFVLHYYKWDIKINALVQINEFTSIVNKLLSFAKYACLV